MIAQMVAEVEAAWLVVYKAAWQKDQGMLGNNLEVAAAHYVMGGPTANNHAAFTLGTAATEINVMHGETAAASYARRLVKA